jgi:hypothetical protein
VHHRDFIWDCDYGEHLRITAVLKSILAEQSSNELGMCALFINNNPYNLEFYVELGYENPKEVQVKKMLELMTSVGARQRPDITMNELMNEVKKKRFNVFSATSPETVELIESTAFQIKERKDVAKMISMKPLGKKFSVFLSHSSADELFVEGIIPYLNNQNLPVWYSIISIDYGTNILSAVQSGVKDSGAVVFFITRNFLESSWCKMEMDGFLSRYAEGQYVLLLSVVHHNVNHNELPFFIQRLKYLKLKSESESKSLVVELMPVLKKHFNL